MTAYISVSFSKRRSLEKELTAIVDALTCLDIVPFVFVDTYQFNLAQEQKMMQQAMSDIGRCDLLIAETSEKAIGIGIEAGYAKAKGKPIVYLRQKDAEHSTTVSGISDFQIIYADADDLHQKLKDTLKEQFR